MVLSRHLGIASGAEASVWGVAGIVPELAVKGGRSDLRAHPAGRAARPAPRPPPRAPLSPPPPEWCWDGEPLGENEFVVCADEKTSIQARCRCHPTLPPGKAPMMRVEHEYERTGAMQYLAGYDVHRARVIGRMEAATGIEPFGRLVAQVMTTEPYASADRVFWVVDNGSSHRGRASVTRMSKAWPTARLVHLPVHASWLNQVVRHEVAREQRHSLKEVG
jgi:hypothetical protein